MKTVAVLATLDTKGAEAAFLREEISRLGGEALLIDIGVLEDPAIPAEVSAAEVARRGGRSLEDLRARPNRSEAGETMAKGAKAVLTDLIAQGRVQSVIGFGGTQGTNNVSSVMQDLPYGFPKIIVSTLASGDVSPYVGIKDIAMMPSVGDILGLNGLLRRILSNAAGAAYGMALAAPEAGAAKDSGAARPTVALTNLGCLTRGAMRAIKALDEKGYETVVFHAVGSGGKALEQMIREGLLAGVFDYGLGDLADAVHGGLRAADGERLTVAARHKLPQVVAPGGVDHIGVQLSAPNSVPEKYKNHRYGFHNSMILVPRPNREETRAIAAEIGRRLEGAAGSAVFMTPLRGVSSYSAKGGDLYDPEADRDLVEALRAALPEGLERIEIDASAEDEAFVLAAVEKLTAMIEARKGAA